MSGKSPQKQQQVKPKVPPKPKAATKKGEKKSLTTLLREARKAKKQVYDEYKKKKASQKPVKKPKQVSSALKKIIVHKRTKPLLVKLKALAKKKGVTVDQVLIKKKRAVFKKVKKGSKNGSIRKVLIKKGPKFYPTETRPKKSKTGRVTHKSHPRKFKKGLEPGRILIILAGKHRGKRVVLLKTLKSGLLLVNGPFKINGCPIKRMHQKFVIVTRTRIPFDKVKVPRHIDDRYFRSKKVASKNSKTKQGGNIFAQKKTASTRVTRIRGEDQIQVDKQVINAIKETMGDKKSIFAYLGSFFYLRNHMYPHKLKF